MKDRLSFLLFIAGGVLGVTVGRSLPVSEPVMLAIAAVGGFLLGFSYLLFNSVYAGTVWGVRIKSSGASKLKQFIGALGMALGGFSFLVSGLELLSSLSAGRVVHAAVLVGLFLVSAILGPFRGSTNAYHSGYQQENHCRFLQLSAEAERNKLIVQYSGGAMQPKTFTDYIDEIWKECIANSDQCVLTGKKPTSKK